MKVKQTKLNGVIVLEPNIYPDQRGFFLETWNNERYAEIGITCQFVQDNLSYSNVGVLRGLHFQQPNGQAKLVYAIQGEIYDVAVDIRQGSPSYGNWYAIKLNSGNGHQIYIPEGFAHGFCVTSKTAIVAYKCSDIYVPTSEKGLLWNDPDLGIDWPVKDPILSEKDLQNTLLKNYNKEDLPVYTG